ncbi:hypothetical protein Tco_0476069 [Tanacetum coccineum]
MTDFSLPSCLEASELTNPPFDFHLPLDLPRYGYIKNHKKTIKNGQTRTRERKSVQEPEAKVRKVNYGQASVKESQTLVKQKFNHAVKSKGFFKLKGGKDNSMALVQDGRDKIIISRLLLVNQARKCHVEERKAQGLMKFTLSVLSKEAQSSNPHGCHAGNPCELSFDPRAIIDDPMIG